jgi:hypothetical protein
MSAPDVDWRHLIFEAASSKGMRQWMVRSWLLHGTRSERNDLPMASLVQEVEGVLA